MMVCTTDQLLRGNRYLGNFYPSRASKEYREMMAAMTTRVGNYLSRLGFRGLFGMDFLITKDGHCYPTDLNPRRQGGYYCNVLMTDKVDLIELELKLALGEKIPEMKPIDFKVDYCWAQSKLAPYYANMQINKEFKSGDPLKPFQKIGSTHSAIYYPKNHILLAGNPGFYLTTSHTYLKMRRKLLKETEEIISKSYDLYEGL
jgi:biotin carboxylase